MFNDSSSGSSFATGMKNFLESNSIVGKFAFILLILLVFMIFLRFGIYVLSLIFGPDGTPHLFDGMIPGTEQRVFEQDPGFVNSFGKKTSSTILRSNDQRGGIEFTWSVWLYIESKGKPTTNFQHIFSKGNPEHFTRGAAPSTQNTSFGNGMMFPNNAPGLYLAPNGQNKLVLVMNTFNKIDEKVVIDNVPQNKWVSLIIRCKDKNLDVFVNGIITKNTQFSTPPRQNYGKVFLHLNNGYPGYTSNLWYWNYAIGTATVNSVVRGGPNTTLASRSGINDKSTQYLSSKWYFAGQGDMFNPVI
tara:strand:+ start:3008 stop:3913 length:906 start_codon:yes stop_codon:yes gene_type:complete